jgi:Xaa-Pro aminopeptidase
MRRIMPALYHERLNNLRIIMQQRGIHAFYLGVGDPYFSEYPPEHFKRLEWLTGFTGSAGAVIILQETAVFFTDGRYSLQAEQQLQATDYTILNSSHISPMQWLKSHAERLHIGIDPWLISLAQFHKWQQNLPQHSWKMLAENPIDTLWTTHRPPLADAPAFDFPVQIAGKSREEKLAILTAALQHHHADAALITLPESLNWLLNLRGRDIAHTPLLLCRALIQKDGAVELFAPLAKLQSTLCHNMTATRSMEEACASLKHQRVLLDPQVTPLALTTILEQSGAILIAADDPCSLPKACKTAAEIQYIEEAHRGDGAALTRFLHWLDTTAEPLSEVFAAEKLDAIRAEHPDFIEPSFPTISGFGANGAIVHYRATATSNTPFTGNSLYLVDSGGQYRGGTTDVTRTLAIGTPSEEMKRHYTLVLKGHIALATAKFPRGTSGRQLDSLARAPLWQEGLDYDHGTGHGVGCCLGVHEGPQRIGKLGSDTPLQEGMILSNEPGYYRTGHYGIRIENLVRVVAVEETENFLGFAPLTLAPLDARLVLPELLTDAEKHWWNQYHEGVIQQLAPLLPKDCLEWLKNHSTLIVC